MSLRLPAFGGTRPHLRTTSRPCCAAGLEPSVSVCPATGSTGRSWLARYTPRPRTWCCEFHRRTRSRVTTRSSVPTD